MAPLLLPVMPLLDPSFSALFFEVVFVLFVELSVRSFFGALRCLICCALIASSCLNFLDGFQEVLSHLL